MRDKIICAISFCLMLILGGQEGSLFPYLNFVGGGISLFIFARTARRLHENEDYPK